MIKNRSHLNRFLCVLRKSVLIAGRAVVSLPFILGTVSPASESSPRESIGTPGAIESDLMRLPLDVFTQSIASQISQKILSISKAQINDTQKSPMELGYQALLPTRGKNPDQNQRSENERTLRLALEAAGYTESEVTNAEHSAALKLARIWIWDEVQVFLSNTDLQLKKSKENRILSVSETETLINMIIEKRYELYQKVVKKIDAGGYEKLVAAESSFSSFFSQMFNSYMPEAIVLRKKALLRYYLEAVRNILVSDIRTLKMDLKGWELNARGVEAYHLPALLFTILNAYNLSLPENFISIDSNQSGIELICGQLF